MTVGLIKLKIDGIQYEFHINSNGEAIVKLRNLLQTLELLETNIGGSAKLDLFKKADEVRGLIKSRTSEVNHKAIEHLLNT